MTKFHKYRSNSPFCEIMIPQDKNTFELAYSNAEKVTLMTRTRTSVARKWVIDVLHVFAMRVDLTFAQSKQLFELGGIDGYRNIFGRRMVALEATLPELNRIKDPNKRTIALEQYNKDWTAYKKVIEMDHQSLMDYLRGKFGDALSLRHPNAELRTNTFSGTASHKSTEHKPAPRGQRTAPGAVTVEVKRQDSKNKKFLKSQKVITAAHGHAEVMADQSKL